MRVGFITQLLWPRYGEFWVRLLAGVGAEPSYSEPETTLRLLSDTRLQAIPGLSFQLAAAQALALPEVDVLIAPDLNQHEDVPRGGGQDPWIASFPEMLKAHMGGLPPMISVPATLEPNLESIAINTLHSLVRDPASVRRVWEQHRSLATPPRHAVRWQRETSEMTVGVIGQPWLLTDTVLEGLQTEGVYLLSQGELEPRVLREEGQRLGVQLSDTDSEVLGAARLLGRKGSVDKLLLIADENSGADAWLVKQVQRHSHKPLEVKMLQEVVDAGSFLIRVPS